MRNTSNSTINHKLASKLVNGIKSSISILLISLGTLLTAAKPSQAQQVFPVLANMQVNPPYSPYLSDYTAAGTNKLQLNLFLKDLTKTNYQCRLRLKIEGLGITIQSKNDFPVVPLTLNGGELSTFSGSELASYLNPQNLVFQGIDETEIRRNGGKLPEGLYRFTIEVQDYYRRTVVSNAALAVMPIFLAYPPIINLPLNGSRVTATEPQNVIFQWTPRNAASTSSAYNTAYNVKLVEIIPAGRDANDAIRSSRPIYETYTDRTMLVYGPAEPALTPGASYALQVQAIEAEGRELFVNNGYSEVVRFTYGERCPTPPSVTLELAGTNAVKVSWAIMPGQQAFSIRYRQAGNPTAQWFEKETYTSSETIDGLRPSTSYEFQVKAQCTYGYGDYSETQTFNMPDEDFSKGDFVCGRADDGALSDQGSPLLLLRPSMIFIAGKFPVKVTTASGGNGVYSGTGTLGVPFLNYLSFKVSFQDIRINTELKMTSGKVVFVRQQLEQSIEDGIKSITVAPDENGNVTAINSNGLPTIIDAAITSWPQAMPVYDAASKTVKFSASVNGGAPKEITLKLVDGQPPLTFQDKNQETFKVDEQGKVTYMGRENPTQFFGSGASTNFTIDTSRGKVAFAPNSGQQYGFDGYDTGLAAKSKTYAADYLPLNDGDDTHRASWKSMESRQFDKVKAILSITDPKLDPKKLAFVTGKGDTLSSTLQNDNTYIISLAGALPGNGSEIYAVYPPDKGAAKGTSGTYMGRLNIYSYAKLSKKLVIVPVNGAGTGINATALEGGLNRIYQQAVAEWKVELAGNFKTDAGFDNLDNGNSSSMSAYTEAQKRLAKAYRDAGNRMDDGTYYIFVVKALSNGDAGYMVRGGQVGFISSTDVRTIAHELGHGAYKLQHTWDQYGLERGSTNNLMDYASGTELWYGQWRYMRNPDVIFRPLEGDDEGAEKTGTTTNQLFASVAPNTKAGLTAFLSPDGAPIYLDRSKVSGYLGNLGDGTLAGFRIEVGGSNSEYLYRNGRYVEKTTGSNYEPVKQPSNGNVEALLIVKKECSIDLYTVNINYPNTSKTIPPVSSGKLFERVKITGCTDRLDKFFAEKGAAYTSMLEKIYAIATYFKKCDLGDWKPYEGGIVPYCFWQNSNTSKEAYYTTFDIPYRAGIIDGAYGQAKGLVELREQLEKIIYAYAIGSMGCDSVLNDVDDYNTLLDEIRKLSKEKGILSYVEKSFKEYKAKGIAEHVRECIESQRIIEQTSKGIDRLYEIVEDDAKLLEIAITVAQRLGSYVDKINKNDELARYEKGKLTTEVLALFIGTEEASAAKRLAEFEKFLARAAKQDIEKIGGKVAERTGQVVNGAWDLLTAEGKFIDNLLETDYAKYLARKAKQGKLPRERLDWKEARDYWLNESPIARGNAFNKKAWDEKWYPYWEVYLENGKYVDGYNPITKEIISRKATNLEEIELSTFESYLKEMKNKYAPGKIIKSKKPGYEILFNKPLEGKQILEIPSSNQNYSQIQDYIDLAKNKYDIEIRFKSE